jgi:hypothetical protein
MMCRDLSAFTPVLDRAAGLLAALIGAGLLLNALRGAATYAHAHGEPGRVAHAKAIFKETGVGLAIAVLATPIISPGPAPCRRWRASFQVIAVSCQLRSSEN